MENLANQPEPLVELSNKQESANNNNIKTIQIQPESIKSQSGM